jgi:methylmalonyl-CoA mutase C-terminal domain/subunit
LEQEKSRVRVLLAKPGLDGHDRGAKVVAMLLRDAGMEVIYTGLRQSVDQIVATAVQEGVDIIALSILSGVHKPLSRKLIAKLREKGVAGIPVIVGGVIPPKDIPELKRTGVLEVFPVHASFEGILSFFNKRFRKETGGPAEGGEDFQV